MNGYSPGSPSRSGRSARQVLLGVERLDLDPGVGEPPRVVGADDRRDRAVLVGGRHRGGYPGRRIDAAERMRRRRGAHANQAYSTFEGTPRVRASRGFVQHLPSGGPALDDHAVVHEHDGVGRPRGRSPSRA